MSITPQILSDFVLKIGQLYRPDNPGKRYEIQNIINDIYTCSILLFEVISSDESDDTLERLDKDFNTHLEKIVSLSELDSLPIAIEGLAQKYEAFLKKIAYFKYKDTDYWSGNKDHVGITGTTFKSLCEGDIQNHYGSDSKTITKIPEPLVNYSGITRNLLDFTRQKLRNAVHYAPEFNRKDLIPYSEIVISIYLITIQDNYDFLAKKFLPYEQYKHKLINHFKKWNELFVELDLNYKSDKDFLELSPELKESDWDTNNSDLNKRSGTINDIISTINRLVIIGGPGQGKTTTLQYLGLIIASNTNIFPVYFPLRDYTSSSDLISQIANSVGIDEHAFIELIASERIFFLLDGLNEIIIKSEKQTLLKQLKHLIKKFQNSPILITTRPKGYFNELNIPIFELLPLTQEKIKDFLVKYYKEKGGQLFEILITAPRLVELCRNPLMLKILASTCITEKIEIPSNKGLLLKAFTDNLIFREKTKNYELSPEKIIYFLTHLAYKSRIKENVSLDFNDSIEIINSAAEIIDPSVDRMKVINTLLDLSILNKNNNRLSFSHELYQEYFAAEGIKSFCDDLEVMDLSSNPFWDQVIIMYSGLIKEQNSFIIELSSKQPLLAVECALASIEFEDGLRETLIEINYNNAILLEEQKRSSESLLALINLNESDKVVEAIKFTFKELGKKAFAYYGDISYEIITRINNSLLITAIKTFLSIDIAFTKMILRAIANREHSEIIALRNELEYLILDFDIENLSADYVLILLDLINDGNTELIIALFNRVIVSQNTINKPIIKSFIAKEPKCTESILNLSLDSENLRCQIESVVFCNYLNIGSNISDKIQEIDFYRNPKIMSQIQDITVESDNYIEDIQKIHTTIIKNRAKKEEKEKLKRLANSLNQWLNCRILAVSSKGYVSMYIIDYKMTGRLYKEEITDLPEPKPGTSMKCRISYLDIKKKIILLSQKETGNTNYEVEKEEIDLPPGSKISVRIIKIVPNYLVVATKKGQRGSIHISQISKEFIKSLNNRFDIGQFLNATIIGKSEKYGLVLSILNENEEIHKPATESDIAIKLKQALRK